MNYLIINGDCLSTLPKLKRGFFDLVFTSPPYWQLMEYGKLSGEFDNCSLHEYKNRLLKLSQMLSGLLKDTGLLVINIDRSRRVDGFIPFSGFEYISIARKAGFKLVDTIIWRGALKRNIGSPRFLEHMYEPIMIFAKTDSYHYQKEALNSTGFLSDLWSIYYDDPYDRSGIATYPVSLAVNIIRLCSPLHGNVLDPFLGSGSTIDACIRARRNCVGIEINPEYSKKANERCKSILFDNDILSLRDEQSSRRN